jgi:hypothetical protein
MPLPNRDVLGRITADPNSPCPFAELGRTEATVSFRVPERVRAALRLVARQREITVTALIHDTLAPVLQPVLQGQVLHDRAAFPLVSQPLSLPRLTPRPPKGEFDGVATALKQPGAVGSTALSAPHFREASVAQRTPGRGSGLNRW